ncbi:MAG: polysaccharide deacetylase family protein [Paludibacteraceae bacterium]|nr:polysaccharide deacetylase family protein [Paludibacteraceae bacterium]MBR5972409.1 polysaccharide deacetylase family protein [Paludibacteraceae bacterium]
MLIEQVPTVFRKFFPKTVWRLPKKEKTVFLTFDDGPIPEETPFVLDILRQHNIKATFFCVGENVKKHPDIFQMVLNDGHVVGNHTYNHLAGFTNFSKHYIDNVAKADEFIHSHLFRPPHGTFRIGEFFFLRRHYTIVFWDVVTRDYNNKLSGEEVLNIVKRYTRNGSIIVFHDSLKASKNMRYALPRAIEYLKSEGYHFDVLSEETING